MFEQRAIATRPPVDTPSSLCHDYRNRLHGETTPRRGSGPATNRQRVWTCDARGTFLLVERMPFVVGLCDPIRVPARGAVIAQATAECWPTLNSPISISVARTMRAPATRPPGPLSRQNSKESMMSTSSLTIGWIGAGRMGSQLVGCGGFLLFDCHNIRYTTQTWIGGALGDKMIRYCLLTRDRDPILWDFDTPHPPGGMITTPDGANIHAERRAETGQVR
jgi:hypothetical protein